MKNFFPVKATLLLILVTSLTSCETESVADQESLYLDNPVEDIQATRKDRITESDV